jgi:hypothetical protein
MKKLFAFVVLIAFLITFNSSGSEKSPLSNKVFIEDFEKNAQGFKMLPDVAQSIASSFGLSSSNGGLDSMFDIVDKIANLFYDHGLEEGLKKGEEALKIRQIELGAVKTSLLDSQNTLNKTKEIFIANEKAYREELQKAHLDALTDLFSKTSERKIVTGLVVAWMGICTVYTGYKLYRLVKKKLQK